MQFSAFHAIAQGEVELELFLEFGLQLVELGCFVLFGVAENVQTLGADIFGIGVDFALPLHFGYPIVQLFEFVFIVSPCRRAACPRRFSSTRARSRGRGVYARRARG